MLSSKARLFLKPRIINAVNFVNFSSLQKPESSEISPITDKLKREPFMKNIFVGVFDDVFLQYPVPNLNDSFQKLLHLANQIKFEITNKPSLRGIEKFKFLLSQGVLKFQYPKLYDGTDVLQSELLHFYEELDLDPSMCVLLDNQSRILQILLSHGSEEQKEKYLEKLIAGEISGACAMTEEGIGSDPVYTRTTIEEEDDFYRLNGEKIWVANGENADFFMVFADNVLGNRKGFISDLSLIIVEKNENVITEKHNLLGLSDCGFCKVKFRDILVPRSNLIGSAGDAYGIAAQGLSHSRLIVLSAILRYMKYFLRSTIHHIHGVKQYPVDLKDSETVKVKITEIVNIIYALESMLYLTTGVLDSYVIDTNLESLILQLFAYTNGMSSISNCMELLGSKAYDNSFPFEKLWYDLKGFTLSTNPVDVISMYISLIGMDYAGKIIKEEIRMSRNPYNFPGFTFKQIIKNVRQEKDQPRLNLKLYMNLHPRLKSAADQLEYCVLRLQYVVEHLLQKHGLEISRRQLELKRVAEIATGIYAMVAVLSRASHSFCTGIKFCEQEVVMASSFCYNTYTKIRSDVKTVVMPDKKIDDVCSFEIASHFINNKLYHLENPMIKNIQ